MPIYGPALQQSYNFNLVRLNHFVGLLSEHCDEKISQAARNSLNKMFELIKNLVEEHLREKKEQDKIFDEGPRSCLECQSPNLAQKKDKGLLITYCTECNYEFIFESTYSMKRRFITLPEGPVLFQVIISDDQDESRSLEHALLNKNRMQSIVKLEGDVKARIHEYNSLIYSLNEWLKSKLFSQIIGKTLSEAKEYFQPIFEREIQEAKQGQKEFIRRMIFEDQFTDRIDVNLPDDASPEELEIYKELSEEHSDDRIRIRQKKAKNADKK
jgi:transcriptional regulator of heat shock response